jgi:hypothetical protein
MKSTHTLTLLAVSVLLGACGGGGSGSDSPAVTTPIVVLSVPLGTAMANLVNLNRSGSLTVVGTAGTAGQTVNVTGSGTYSEATTAGSFEGVAGLRKTLSINGTLVGTSGGQTSSAPLNALSDAYYDSNYKPVGLASTGSYCVTASYTAPPVNAQVGLQSDWYGQDCYSSSAKTIKQGTVALKYAVEADSATSVLLKVTTTSRASNGTTVPGISTYRVTSAGAVTRLNDTSTATVTGVAINLTINYQ